MTVQQDLLALRDRLREVLGNEHATTLMAMVRERDDLVTTSDLKHEMAVLRTELKSEMADFRTELKSEMADFGTELKAEIAELRTDMAEFKTEIRSEIAQIRTEMDLKFTTKDDLAAMSEGFQSSLHSFVRTFIVVQAATVVGISGILFGLLRFA